MYLKSFVFLPEMGVRKDVGYLQTSTTIPCGGWLNQCSFPSSTFPSSSFPFSFTLKSLKILFQSQLILPMSLFSPRIKQNLLPPSFFRPSHFLSLLIPSPTCIQGDRDLSGKSQLIKVNRWWLGTADPRQRRDKTVPFFLLPLETWEKEKIAPVGWRLIFTTLCFSPSWPSPPPAGACPAKVKVSLTGSAERMSTEKFDGRARCAHSQSSLTHLSN